MFHYHRLPLSLIYHALNTCTKRISKNMCIKSTNHSLFKEQTCKTIHTQFSCNITRSIFTTRINPCSLGSLSNQSSYLVFGFQCALFRRCSTSVHFEKLERHLGNLFNKASSSKLPIRDGYLELSLLEEKDKLDDNLRQLRSMKATNNGNTKDEKEMLDLIEEEIRQFTSELEEVKEKIINCLVPVEDFEDCNEAVLEISAGVGGMEAMLFANDLCQMYCSFLEYKGWQYFIAEEEKTELGGIRHCTLMVSGSGAYKVLQLEAGVHRVQRVPATERGGRVHTSTVSVAVLPQPSDVDVVIKESDLKIDTKRASGAGGQHVNTTDSAVRITHLPTGMIVECQLGKSQIQNKQTALMRLKAKLYEKQTADIDSSIRSQRKQQIGTSSRSEKIRTYNFRDDRISDHRITANIHNLKAFLEGGESLDNLHSELSRWYRNQQIQRFINTLPIT